MFPKFYILFSFNITVLSSRCSFGKLGGILSENKLIIGRNYFTLKRNLDKLLESIECDCVLADPYFNTQDLSTEEEDFEINIWGDNDSKFRSYMLTFISGSLSKTCSVYESTYTLDTTLKEKYEPNRFTSTTLLSKHKLSGTKG